jgi:hypothetical protein
MLESKEVAMTKIRRLALALAGTGAIGLGTTVDFAEAKQACVMAGGEATMITADLAKFMAEAALKNSINGMDAKPAGQVALTCTTGVALSTCTAKQRACK